MRAVFVGVGSLALMTARRLLKRGHEVVMIDWNKDRIDALAEELDCGFLHGDGSKPALLREADPSRTDFLFCLTGNDQTNILASLAGRSLGYRGVVPKIDDPEFEHLCIELGLEDVIIPARTTGRYLATCSKVGTTWKSSRWSRTRRGYFPSSPVMKTRSPSMSWRCRGTVG